MYTIVMTNGLYLCLDACASMPVSRQPGHSHTSCGAPPPLSPFVNLGEGWQGGEDFCWGEHTGEQL